VAKKVRKNNNARFVGTLVVIAIVGIAVLGYTLSRPRAGVKPVDASLIAATAQPYILGNPSAPVTVIEFVDFECPVCAQWSQVTEPDVKTRLINTGLIQFHIFDFPLDMHPNSWPAHGAVACAADQGKFEEMKSAVFSSQDKWARQYGNMNPAPALRDAAKSVGVDLSAWDACFDSQKHYARIKGNLEQGLKLGVGGTPAFVIGGQLHSSQLPYDMIKQLVDSVSAATAASSKSTKVPPKAPGKSDR
jgi:protein-disulfide isomerase